MSPWRLRTFLARPSAERRRADGLPRSLQKQLDDIDKWSQGQVLPQALAVEIRRIVREAMISRIEWFDIVVKEPDTATLAKAIPENARGVSIEDANENLALAVPPLLRIERSARNATTLKGLALIRGGHPARAGDALARLDALVSGSVGEAKQRILAELAIDDASLVQVAASLIKGAAACGVLPARPKEIDYVNACLWREASERPDAAARAPEWVTAYRDYLAVRGKAVDLLMAGIGAAQGTGGVYAIDIQRLIPIVRKAKDLANSDDDFEVPAWCTEAHRRLKALLRTNGRQIAHWRELIRSDPAPSAGVSHLHRDCGRHPRGGQERAGPGPGSGKQPPSFGGIERRGTELGFWLCQGGRATCGERRWSYRYGGTEHARDVWWDLTFRRSPTTWSRRRNGWRPGSGPQRRVAARPPTLTANSTRQSARGSNC